MQGGSLEQYGFLYQKGTFTPLPDAGEFYVPTITGMNKKGIVVGTMNSFNLYGFAYIGGKMRFFQYPGATYTSFNGISDNDVVVGTYSVEKTGKIGIFSYDIDTNAWTDLNFPAQHNAVTPVGITNAGVIAAANSPSGGLLIATPTN
jgi:hypothetical protein